MAFKIVRLDMPTETLRYSISGYANQKTDATVEVIRFDRKARVRRAVSALALWWAAALVSIFIPIAHFALVPGFFIYGIVAARQRLKTEIVATRIEGTCPDCGAAQQFPAGGRWNPPMETACGECSRRLVIG